MTKSKRKYSLSLLADWVAQTWHCNQRQWGASSILQMMIEIFLELDNPFIVKHVWLADVGEGTDLVVRHGVAHALLLLLSLKIGYTGKIIKQLPWLENKTLSHALIDDCPPEWVMDVVRLNQACGMDLIKFDAEAQENRKFVPKANKKKKSKTKKETLACETPFDIWALCDRMRPLSNSITVDRSITITNQMLTLKFGTTEIKTLAKPAGFNMFLDQLLGNLDEDSTLFIGGDDPVSSLALLLALAGAIGRRRELESFLGSPRTRFFKATAIGDDEGDGVISLSSLSLSDDYISISDN